MALGLKTGARLSGTETTDQILQIEQGINFLNTQDNGIKFIKRLIANRGDKVAKSYKYQWDETALPVRRETVTLADGSGTALTVANSAAYHVGDVLKIEAELVRVTVLVNATTLTIVRAYGGTTGAAHAAKLAFNLGYIAAENSTGPAAITTTANRLYNYIQQTEEAVELSDLAIATETTDGNPMNSQLERLTLSYWKRMANSILKGVRYEDTSLNQRLMGGIDFFLTTNITSVGGALTIAAIDAMLYSQVIAGGNPGLLVMHPYQKQKLDALDANKQYLQKSEHVGGNLVTQSWQSGVLDHMLDVMVDHTLDTTELYSLDMSTLALIPLHNNGIDGRLSVVEATLPGQSGRKKLLRSYYTLEMVTEAANGKLTTLTQD